MSFSHLPFSAKAHLTHHLPSGSLSPMSDTLDSIPPTPRKKRWLRRCFVAVLISIALLFAAASLMSTSDSRAFGHSVADWIRQSEQGQVFDTTLSITSVKGLTEKISGHSLSLRWQAPSHLLLRTEVDGKKVALARDDRLIWIQREDSGFTVVGDETVPCFADDPSSIMPISLPPYAIPVHSSIVRFLLPVLVSVSPHNPDSSEQRISPSRLGQLIGLPDFTLDLIETPSAENVLQCRVSFDGKEVDLAFRNATWTEADADDPNWAVPKDAKIERVALSHLVRSARVLRSRIGAKTPPLPPNTGKAKIVRTSGKGRLEDHEGLHVLFLSGSPEEIGRQHGELLGPEVRSVVEKMVYGIGVASSFAKNRWFFGEIEEATNRSKPFVPPSYLTEMSALASAAGLRHDEVQLANFFPELFHCSGFALHGKATVDGKLYHGRILDYMIGVGLEDNAVVMIYRPDDGNAWVNVSYAGFVGSVTAMNEKKVAIGEMGGRGEGNWDGKPMAQLVREVMERCDTIDEAVELMRNSPRTCEYYYVISDGKTHRAVGIKATPDIFETVWSGESHPQLPDPVEDTVLLSAGDRYKELVSRVKKGYGHFDPESARELMTRPVCMKSNIQSVLFGPDTLDFWVAYADSKNVASHARYTHLNLAELLENVTSTPEQR